MNRIWTIARREVQSLFDQPTGYVLLIVFVVINDFLFFREVRFSGSASLRPMLELLPWIFLFFVPAVSMRSLAEDIRTGLLETVLSQPLTELELLLGKYLGVVIFLCTALLLTVPIPLALSVGAHLQWGTLVAQYTGAAFLAAGLAGVGLWGSSLTRSQITAFIVSVAIMFALVLVGLDPLLVGLPPLLGTIAARIGVLSHFAVMGRGVIDLRDAIYFVSLAGVFLMLAYGALMTRKLAPHGAPRKRLQLGVSIVVAGLIVLNLLGGYIGGRLDLTPGGQYSLSKTTKQIVGQLDDLVTIKVFVSKELPAEVSQVKRDVDDILRDLRTAGRGKIKLIISDPADDAAAKQDATSLGIQPVQFNVVGREELQVKQGYLGLAILYGNGQETIPFIQQTDDLEYRLVSSIRTLTRTKKSVVGLYAPSGGGQTYQALQEQLAKSYDVRRVTLVDSVGIANETSVLILAGAPDSLGARERSRLEAFIARGGNALVMAGGMNVSNRQPVAIPRLVAYNDALKPFGASIRSDIVYDLLANEIVPVPSEFGRALKQYPFFIRARSTGASVVNRDIGEVVLTWPSSIDTSGAKKGTVTPLLVSSRASGVQTGDITIEPTRDWPDKDLAPRLLAAQITPDSGQPVKGRLVVVGDGEFASDRYVQNAPANVAFALNAVDWLAQDEALISIRSKDRRPPALVFSSATVQEAVQYANLIGIPLLIALDGFFRLLRRRRRSLEPYRPLGSKAMEAA